MFKTTKKRLTVKCSSLNLHWELLKTLLVASFPALFSVDGPEFINVGHYLLTSHSDG